VERQRGGEIMAKEAAEAFVKKFGSDEEFRNKVNQLRSAKAIRSFLDQEKLGQFTKQELEDARRTARASGELSDAELEAVAGGAWGAAWEYECKTSYSEYDVHYDCPGINNYSCTSVW
jgi:predicted ribosomally synthesized peptide with nif11-like leader